MVALEAPKQLIVDSLLGFVAEAGLPKDVRTLKAGNSLVFVAQDILVGTSQAPIVVQALGIRHE